MALNQENSRSGQILDLLPIELTEFAEGLDVECRRKKRIKAFCLNSWKDTVLIRVGKLP